ncbi:CPBP family glutamic-type intramembrane protease [Shewanella sp.]|uniref:CPBP family glutamic-type intramembrane protease n=1 Tax=Shewanella sp. TaxID=50422 RepID=UPI00345C716C
MYNTKLSQMYFLILLFPIIYAVTNSSIDYLGFHWLHVPLALLILSMSIIEEVIFRLLIPKVFGRSYTSVILYSIIFALIHIINPGFGVYSFINTFIVSILLYQIRFSLGFKYSILFHFSWNTILAIVLGMTVSGADFTSVVREVFTSPGYNSIFSQETVFNSGYGIESSKTFTLILVSFIFPSFIIPLLGTNKIEKTNNQDIHH